MCGLFLTAKLPLFRQPSISIRFNFFVFLVQSCTTMKRQSVLSLKIIIIGDCGCGVTFVLLQHKSKTMYYG